MWVGIIIDFFFCKQKTAYEMRISDWSSDVCSSDLIDAIGEDDGEKRIAIVGLPARTSVDEAFAEPGPSIDLKQQVGDLHPWQAIIGCATGNFGSGRRCRLQRRDDEAVFVKPDLGQLALSREDRYLFDGRVEPGAPFLDMEIGRAHV